MVNKNSVKNTHVIMESRTVFVSTGLLENTIRFNPEQGVNQVPCIQSLLQAAFVCVKVHVFCFGGTRQKDILDEAHGPRP